MKLPCTWPPISAAAAHIRGSCALSSVPPMNIEKVASQLAPAEQARAPDDRKSCSGIDAHDTSSEGLEAHGLNARYHQRPAIHNTRRGSTWPCRGSASPCIASVVGRYIRA